MSWGLLGPEFWLAICLWVLCVVFPSSYVGLVLYRDTAIPSPPPDLHLTHTMRSKNVSSLLGLEADGCIFGFYMESTNVAHFLAVRAFRLDEKFASEKHWANRTDIRPKSVHHTTAHSTAFHTTPHHTYHYSLVYVPISAGGRWLHFRILSGIN